MESLCSVVFVVRTDLIYKKLIIYVYIYIYIHMSTSELRRARAVILLLCDNRDAMPPGHRILAARCKICLELLKIGLMFTLLECYYCKKVICRKCYEDRRKTKRVPIKCRRCLPYGYNLRHSCKECAPQTPTCKTCKEPI